MVVKTPKKKRELSRTPIKSSIKQSIPFMASNIDNFSVDKLLEVETEFKRRYPQRKDIHLRAIYEHLEVVLSTCGISALPFCYKSYSLQSEWRNGVIGLMSVDLRSQLKDLLVNYSWTDLDKLYCELVPELFDQQAKIGPSHLLVSGFSTMVLLGIILSEFRSSVKAMFEPIDEYLANHVHFRSNPGHGNTLLWILSQSPVLHEAELDIWFKFCLPSFDRFCTSSSVSFQNNSLDYMEFMLEKDEEGAEIELRALDFSSLLFISFSSKSLLCGSARGKEMQSRLETIFQQVKIHTFQTKRFHVNSVDLFKTLHDHLSKIHDPEIEARTFKESANVISFLLTSDTAIYKVWEKKLAMSFETTRLILEQFKDSKLVYSNHIDNPDFYAFVRKVKDKAHNASINEVSDLAQTLLKERSSLWNVLFWIILICIALILFATLALSHYKDLSDILFKKNFNDLLTFAKREFVNKLYFSLYLFMLKIFEKSIPGLNTTLHKGQSGRIGIIGGSSLYTGAPYYAGMTSMRLGVDLVHIFCESEAAIPIKCYSPELIVHPGLDGSISTNFPRLHAILVGPGLGRELKTIKHALKHIQKIRELDLPLVIDADGLFALGLDLDIIKNYRNAVLTPNVVEFKRLCEQCNIDPTQDDAPEKLSIHLGNVTVFVKGPTDIITNGLKRVECNSPGSSRRSGGQGDVLAGTVTTFMAWSHLNKKESEELDTLAASYTAAQIVRKAGNLAFKARGRSMICSDVVSTIPNAFAELFPENK